MKLPRYPFLRNRDGRTRRGMDNNDTASERIVITRRDHLELRQGAARLRMKRLGNPAAHPFAGGPLQRVS
jgi:hypothetical protein